MSESPAETRPIKAVRGVSRVACCRSSPTRDGRRPTADASANASEQKNCVSFVSRLTCVTSHHVHTETHTLQPHCLSSEHQFGTMPTQRKRAGTPAWLPQGGTTSRSGARYTRRHAHAARHINGWRVHMRDARAPSLKSDWRCAQTKASVPGLHAGLTPGSQRPPPRGLPRPRPT